MRRLLRHTRGLAAAAGLLALAGCVRSTGAPASVTAAPGTPVDSATVALWRMDETGGTRAADSGPHRLDAVAGQDTRTAFGRFRNARIFGKSLNSFLYVAPSPWLDLGPAFTIECWLAPNSYSNYEDMTIAARWSPQTDDHSWIFAMVGTRIVSPETPWHRSFVSNGKTGRLMFVFQPEDAGVPLVYHAQTLLELDRWTHVAVSCDGQMVCFWVNGEPDGFFATTGRVRPSRAPLVVGNFIDPRRLTDFGGELRLETSTDATPYYAYDGGMDELRISNVARTRFPLGGGK
jgi:hypothetical protein